jgi:ankyrin repeat protein
METPVDTDENFIDVLECRYPYAGSADAAPVAAWATLAPSESNEAAVPPPMIPMVLHCLYRRRHRVVLDVPLLCAAFDGHTALVLQGLDLPIGSRIAVSSARQAHVIHAAAMGGNLALVKALADRDIKILTEVDVERRGIFHYAAQAHARAEAASTAVLRALFGAVVTSSAAVRRMRESGITLDHADAEYANSAGLGALTDLPAAPLDDQNCTILYSAAHAGALHNVRFILGLSRQFTAPVRHTLAIVDMADQHGVTSLMSAARSGSVDTFNAIFDTYQVPSEARAPSRDGRQTYAHFACMSDNVAMVDRAIAAFGGWDQVPQTPTYSGSLLQCAARSPSTAVYKHVKQQLEQRGLALDPEDGWTTLHSAAMAASRCVFDHVLDVEGQHEYLHARDRDGYTVFHAALLSDDVPFVRHLVHRVPEVVRTVVNVGNRPCAVIPIVRGNMAMLELLLELGVVTKGSQATSSGASLALLAASHAPATSTLLHVLELGCGLATDKDNQGKGLVEYSESNRGPSSAWMVRVCRHLLADVQQPLVRPRIAKDFVPDDDGDDDAHV